MSNVEIVKHEFFIKCLHRFIAKKNLALHSFLKFVYI